MQEIIVEKPYRFAPPHHGLILPRLIVRILDGYLNRNYGIRSYECRNLQRLRGSLDAGHGILLASNHCRPCDPMAIGWLAREVDQPFFCMASGHLFMQSWWQRFMLRRCGAFSVNREGVDHASLNFAVAALTSAERPLVICPEGSVTRSNDRIGPLLDGTALVARMAAKKRLKLDPPGKVVVHTVAFKYFFRGDLQATLEPVLQSIEQRIGWQPQSDLPLLDRLGKLGNALLCLRELEYFGRPQVPDNQSDLQIDDRVERLAEHILTPLEEQWCESDKIPTGIYARVQNIRSRIVPDLAAGKVSKSERTRRWRHLTDCYIAQQLGCYPRNYLDENPSPERILETVERLEEDFTDYATIHRPLDLVIDVGEAIEVSPRRKRGVGEDPIMAAIARAFGDQLEQINANPPMLGGTGGLPTRGLDTGRQATSAT